MPRRRRLNTALESYEALWREFVEVQARLESLDAEREEDEVDRAVEATLAAGREAAEEVKTQARRQSEAALKKARNKAEQIVGEAERERVRLEGEVARLRECEARLRAEYVDLLTVTMDRLQGEIGKIAGSNGAGPAKSSDDTNGYSAIPGAGFPRVPPPYR